MEVNDIAGLEMLFTVEEIKNAIWCSDEDKSSGPYGLNFCFIQKC